MSLAAAGVFSAQASTSLPPRTAAQLLADVENAHVDGLSGTVVAQANLGLPALPEIGGSSSSGSSLVGLLSGSHTARVWYAGPTKQRIALLDAVGETDVFHNGRDVWQWSSVDKTATHTVLADSGQSLFDHPTPTVLTPDQLASQALAAIDPTTAVATDQNRRVADRSAYELVLTPRDATSRVGSVRITVDGQTKIPVSVQVFARGATKSPALDVSFTRLSFAKPSDSQFTFTPPASAKIDEQAAPREGTRSQDDVAKARMNVRTIGQGWTTVVTANVQNMANLKQQPQLAGLKRVDGGYLFDSKLVTAYLTDNGRIFAGAVDPEVLYRAAR